MRVGARGSTPPTSSVVARKFMRKILALALALVFLALACTRRTTVARRRVLGSNYTRCEHYSSTTSTTVVQRGWGTVMGMKLLASAYAGLGSQSSPKNGDGMWLRRITINCAQTPYSRPPQRKIISEYFVRKSLPNANRVNKREEMLLPLRAGTPRLDLLAGHRGHANA